MEQTIVLCEILLHTYFVLTKRIPTILGKCSQAAKRFIMTYTYINKILILEGLWGKIVLIVII